MKLDTCNIYYEAWQIQCCGKPFKIGDRVRWSCIQTQGEDYTCGHKIDFYEEHHYHTPTHTIEGTITEIYAEIAVFKISKLDYDSALKFTIPIQKADCFESDEFRHKEENRYCIGYVVSMKDVEVSDYDEKLKYDYD